MIVPGSSPRVRGKPPSSYLMVDINGLIPACAGKTLHKATVFIAVPAHPRVCGENAQGLDNIHIVRGSSPRVRGKPLGAAMEAASQGLIPACAGKTTC